jgi:hypothetical protein
MEVVVYVQASGPRFDEILAAYAELSGVSFDPTWRGADYRKDRRYVLPGNDMMSAVAQFRELLDEVEPVYSDHVKLRYARCRGPKPRDRGTGGAGAGVREPIRPVSPRGARAITRAPEDSVS